jgi:hypothetical protein
MNKEFANTLEKIIRLENELENEIKKKNRQIILNYQERKIRFEESVRKQQDVYKTRLLKYVFGARLRTVLVAPIIYSMVLPIFLFDLVVSVYQHTCFRVYKIPLVKRKEYFSIDRHHLGYLNTLEKFNCVYCGYGNGVAAYTKEIIARTELFWCPIKHAARVKDPHSRYYNFFEYGDAEGYKNDLETVILKYDQE